MAFTKQQRKNIIMLAKTILGMRSLAAQLLLDDEAIKSAKITSKADEAYIAYLMAFSRPDGLSDLQTAQFEKAVRGFVSKDSFDKTVLLDLDGDAIENALVSAVALYKRASAVEEDAVEEDADAYRVVTFYERASKAKDIDKIYEDALIVPEEAALDAEEMFIARSLKLCNQYIRRLELDIVKGPDDDPLVELAIQKKEIVEKARDTLKAANVSNVKKLENCFAMLKDIVIIPEDMQALETRRDSRTMTGAKIVGTFGVGLALFRLIKFCLIKAGFNVGYTQGDALIKGMHKDAQNLLAKQDKMKGKLLQQFEERSGEEPDGVENQNPDRSEHGGPL